MIISRIKGGIGNQLFIYAASKRLALKNNVELDLFLQRGNCLIIPLDPNLFHISKKIEPKKIPKEGSWPLHGYRSLRSFDGNIVLVDREGWWSVLHLEKSKS